MENRKVLCATDFSKESEKAFDLAIELAEKFDAELHVLHAYNVPIIAAPDGGIITPPSVLAQIDDAARTSMQQLVEKWQKKGVPFVAHVSQGPAARLIVQHAMDLGTDFIVMGTHGRTGLGHLLIGSVAERVVRTSPVPVITVRTTDSPSDHSKT